MIQTLIRLGLVIISWSSLIFLPKKVIYKYLPVSVFTSILVLIISALSIPYKYWIIKGNKTKKLINDLSFVYGPFFAATLWIFHLTFGNFKLYVAVNALMNLILAYPLSALGQMLKVYKLKNFKSKHIFLIYFCFSFLIYGYQILLNRSFINDAE